MLESLSFTVYLCFCLLDTYYGLTLQGAREDWTRTLQTVPEATVLRWGW